VQIVFDFAQRERTFLSLTLFAGAVSTKSAKLHLFFVFEDVFTRSTSFNWLKRLLGLFPEEYWLL